VGVIGGVAMMFAKVPPIAESGAKPTDLWFYAFWIPILGAAAGVFGFGLGLLYSILMALLKNWRSRVESRTGIAGKHGPRILCGTLAGALLGLFFIGVDYQEIFLFAGLGFCSAVVSSFVQSRSFRVGESNSSKNA
jgi:MFS family permease